MGDCSELNQKAESNDKADCSTLNCKANAAKEVASKVIRVGSRKSEVSTRKKIIKIKYFI